MEESASRVFGEGRERAEQSFLCARLAAPQGSIEEQWRSDCLAFARVRKLGHVADMRIFYVARRPPLPLIRRFPLISNHFPFVVQHPRAAPLIARLA
jgi:hypothetical protein